MGTTDQGAAMAPDSVNEVVSTERNSVVIETPKQAEPEQEKSEFDPQKVIDRMGNELGELRKELRSANQRLSEFQAPTPEVERVSFEDNPQQFIEQTIQRTLESTLAPKLQVLESDLLNRQSVKFDESVSESYPDWKETIKADEFAEWVQASPARLQMYQIADKQFDVSSAVELLKRYKQDVAESQATKKGAIGAAGLVRSSGDSGGARVYAASEIQKMIENSPEDYRRWMAGDGMAAYRDGRVDPSR